MKHGWTVQGPTCEDNTSIDCHRIQVHECCQEILTPFTAIKLLERDFETGDLPDECGMSVEDKRFIEIMDKEVYFNDGHYIAPLPFKENKVELTNNREEAKRRLLWQRQKFLKNEAYKKEYTEFMENLLNKGYAEKVKKQDPCEQSTWYLPHHGVYHPKKPNKIRVVFDCSSQYRGQCLNDCLLQGPDLTNSLMGVLLRFRQEEIAFMADIEAMFYQVQVPEYQRDYLRFLWWPGGELFGHICEYRMKVHIFGAISSPSVANYVLKLIGRTCMDKIISSTILKNFYVDDCLKSLCRTEEVIRLIRGLTIVLKQGGFKLTKFACNSIQVMSNLPKEHLCKEAQEIKLSMGELPLLRALGVSWNTKEDSFHFNIEMKENPTTRRGFLSIVSSIYDPMGILAPVILPAKRILQDLCKETCAGWDDDVPVTFIERWQSWCKDLSNIEGFSIPRKILSSNKGSEYQLHVFADASFFAYGCVAYLRTTDQNSHHILSFVSGKS
jgi:hypothetical protein